MESEQKERMFIQYRNMINKFAWYFLKKQRIKDIDTFDDLQAHGYLIFCEALETYNSEIASFSTHLYNQLRGGFCQYNKNKWDYENNNIDLGKEFVIFDNPVKLYFEAALQEISNEAKEMLVFILSSKEKLGLKKLQSYFVSTGTFKKYQFDLIINQLRIWWKNNKNLANLSKTCQNLQEILTNLG